MITDFLIGVLFGFVEWLASLLPTWTEPSWVSGVVDLLNGLFSGVGQLSYLFPVSTFFFCAELVVGTWAACTVVKFMRLAASTIVPGAGSALPSR